MRISVIIPAYNPDEVRLRRSLDALRNQTFPEKNWECILVNNASTRFPDDAFFKKNAPINFRIISEPRLGLNFARACGLSQAKADLAIFVDDDNMLAVDYLESAAKISDAHDTVGVFGGRITPDFEVQPPDWLSEFHGILACWDHGNAPLISPSAQADCTVQWPVFAPVGAGMILRRIVWETWLHARKSNTNLINDRQGSQLTSGGDNELVLFALKAGWQVGYFPSLTLSHLIPKSRLDPNYLARLNFGCHSGFIQVLRKHNACPWPPIPRWTLPLRVARAWFRCRAWRGPANRIRWRGLVGHFTARVR